MAGCSGHALRLAVDPGAYHVRGDYIGAQHRVKLFVEGLRVEPVRQGRGSAVVANIALLNERTAGARFMTGENVLEAGGLSSHPLESHVVNLRPGELTRVTLTFRSPVPQDEFGSGLIHVDGVEPDAAGPAHFTVPFSVADD